ncbi:MAG TPA: phytoene/squalene synthase family protein [Verrucomicrobiae bacterium]|nr:phytoene/squalene synthase family protein [Verrucomicrobiae bacterium]
MRETAILKSLLADVSRSFYLTMRVLPASVRSQIGLAYLLARTTDTIADTAIVPLEHRLRALLALRGRIQGSNREPLDFGELAQHQGSPAERVLLERCEEALAMLGKLADFDRQRIREVLATIISGQELDLRRFAAASAGRLIALETEQELDDYTYRVAGCVGEFWTRMCRAHVFPTAQLDDKFLLENGVRFGKGLQLVNILRDLPADLRNGRCYLPAVSLSATGLSATDLLEPKNEPKLRPLYARYLDACEQHLKAGWAYTNALPRGCVRVRLACAWPIMIGMKTVARLRTENILDPDQRIKISRSDVKKMMLHSVVCYPWPRAWQGLIRSTR